MSLGALPLVWLPIGESTKTHARFLGDKRGVSERPPSPKLCHVLFQWVNGGQEDP